MLTTGSLMSMIAAKQGRRLAGTDWFAAWSWIAAMSLGSAFLAGLAHLAALQHGPAVYGVGAVLVMERQLSLGQLVAGEAKGSGGEPSRPI